MKIFSDVTSCASCLDNTLIRLHDFGKVPLAGYFPYHDSLDSTFLCEMTLLKCKKCGLVQIGQNINDEVLFSDYRYLSKYGMALHFQELSGWIANKVDLFESKILEIGCNDGTLIEELSKTGLQVEGIDPAKNVTARALAKGYKIYSDFFSSNFVRINKLADSYDLIISCNSFAHISSIRDVCEGIALALKSHGKLIIEVQSWPDLVSQSAFDFVYHEHKYYYDLNSISNLLNQFGMFLIDASKIDSHGKSYRLIFEKHGSKNINDFLVASEVLTDDHKIIESLEQYNCSLQDLKSKLENFKKKNLKIIGFGASGRANMMLGQISLNELIDCIFDESPERIGRQMGFTKIPILNFDAIISGNYDICLILAWNHAEQIIKKWPHKGKLMLIPLPNYLEINV